MCSVGLNMSKYTQGNGGQLLLGSTLDLDHHFVLVRGLAAGTRLSTSVGIFHFSISQ